MKPPLRAFYEQSEGYTLRTDSQEKRHLRYMVDKYGDEKVRDMLIHDFETYHRDKLHANAVSIHDLPSDDEWINDSAWDKEMI